MNEKPKYAKNPGRNKMGTMPIPRLLITMAAPMMFSMLVQALYNIVDSYYVSHITAEGIANMGDKAVSALTLVFPVQMLITALCVGTGVGVNAALSKSLGAGNPERASRVAGNSVLLNGVYCLLVMLFGITLGRGFLAGQTSDPLTLELAEDYLLIITLGSAPTFMYMAFEKLLQATGKTVCTMIGQIAGAATNIILDPIFIFGRLGLPAMGVKGAAIATVIGELTGGIVVTVFHFLLNKEIKNGLRYAVPDGGIIGDIYRVGAPAIVMQSLTSVSAYGLNIVLGSISPSAIAAYGIYNKLQSFIFMPSFGLNNASIPIISYNFGAREVKRIRQAIFCALGCVIAIMLAGTVIVECFAPGLAGIFTLSDEANALCIRALRIISLGYILAGSNVVLQGVSQALGNGVNSLVISLLRQMVIILPGAWALSKLPGAANFVWAIFPAAEVCAFAVAAVLVVRLYRKRIRQITVQE